MLNVSYENSGDGAGGRAHTCIQQLEPRGHEPALQNYQVWLGQRNDVDTRNIAQYSYAFRKRDTLIVMAIEPRMWRSEIWLHVLSVRDAVAARTSLSLFVARASSTLRSWESQHRHSQPRSATPHSRSTALRPNSGRFPLCTN
jgi:hypothetical protein